jgi:hypothetical protein
MLSVLKYLGRVFLFMQKDHAVQNAIGKDKVIP